MLNSLFSGISNSFYLLDFKKLFLCKDKRKLNRTLEKVLDINQYISQHRA